MIYSSVFSASVVIIYNYLKLQRKHRNSKDKLKSVFIIHIQGRWNNSCHIKILEIYYCLSQCATPIFNRYTQHFQVSNCPDIDVISNKTLRADRDIYTWSDFKIFCIFQHFIFQNDMNLPKLI